MVELLSTLKMLGSNLLDVVVVREQHGQPIDSQAPSSSWRQPVPARAWHRLLLVDMHPTHSRATQKFSSSNFCRCQDSSQQLYDRYKTCASASPEACESACCSNRFLCHVTSVVGTKDGHQSTNKTWEPVRLGHSTQSKRCNTPSVSIVRLRDNGLSIWYSIYEQFESFSQAC